MVKIFSILVTFSTLMFSVSYADNDQFYTPQFVFDNCAKLLNKTVIIKSVAGNIRTRSDGYRGNIYNLFVEYNSETGVVTFLQGEFDKLDSNSVQLMYEIDNELQQATADSLQTGKELIIPKVIVTGKVIWTRNIVGKKNPGIKMIKLERDEN